MQTNNCYECRDIGLQFLPNGLIAECRRVQMRDPLHNPPSEAGVFVRRAVLTLQHRAVPVNSHLFDLAVTLSCFSSAQPAGRDSLLDAHFKYAPEHSRLRHFHKAIEDLRRQWLLPVGSRKDAPAGYWIMTEQSDFSAWVERSKAAPITQLSTIHRVARANFPVFAEQLELEFFSDIQVQDAERVLA